MFSAVTHNIQVEVEPSYVSEESDPRQSHYFFSYRVRISNKSEKQVQLLSRYWLITDGFGAVEEVEGSGVIGLQPTIKPGETFEYSSFCPLSTPSGFMQGKYTMLDAQGRRLEVEIPRFILTEPTNYH